MSRIIPRRSSRSAGWDSRGCGRSETRRRDRQQAEQGDRVLDFQAHHTDQVRVFAAPPWRWVWSWATQSSVVTESVGVLAGLD